MSRFIKFLFAFLAVSALAFSVLALSRTNQVIPKVGFVNSQRIITGFKPAYEVEKQLREEEEKFKNALKAKEDSLKNFIDSMSAVYNKGDSKLKRMLQDELSAKNQEINNITLWHSRRMEKMRTEKMQAVFEMINSFMLEFGRKNEYSMIFGTVQGGNILYGEGTAADLTQPILDGLNDRYK